MNLGGLHTGRGRLNDALKKLHGQWEITSEVWRDKVAEDFVKNHIDPCDQPVMSAIAAIDRMTEIISRAARDLSDENEW